MITKQFIAQFFGSTFDIILDLKIEKLHLFIRKCNVKFITLPLNIYLINYCHFLMEGHLKLHLPSLKLKVAKCFGAQIYTKYRMINCKKQLNSVYIVALLSSSTFLTQFNYFLFFKFLSHKIFLFQGISPVRDRYQSPPPPSGLVFDTSGKYINKYPTSP